MAASSYSQYSEYTPPAPEGELLSFSQYWVASMSVTASVSSQANSELGVRCFQLTPTILGEITSKTLDFTLLRVYTCLDPDVRNIIDKLAVFVARNGVEFEQMTMEKQRDNPKFNFLFGGESHVYYRWRVGQEQASLYGQHSQQPGQLNIAYAYPQIPLPCF